MKPTLVLALILTALTFGFALTKPASAQANGNGVTKSISAPKDELALGAPIPLTAGQSVIMCASTDANVINAVSAINQKLVTSRHVLTMTAGGVLVSVTEPYTVSSPSLTSYDRVGNDDVACVTITKQ